MKKIICLFAFVILLASCNTNNPTSSPTDTVPNTGNSVSPSYTTQNTTGMPTTATPITKPETPEPTPLPTNDPLPEPYTTFEPGLSYDEMAVVIKKHYDDVINAISTNQPKKIVFYVEIS